MIYFAKDRNVVKAKSTLSLVAFVKASFVSASTMPFSEDPAAGSRIDDLTNRCVLEIQLSG